MKELFLVKEGEIVLKGLNKRSFEDVLLKNIRESLSEIGEFRLKASQSTITITPIDDFNSDEILKRLGSVFGISAFSKAVVCDKDFERIKKVAIEYLKEDLVGVCRFKVRAKRSDKTFCMTSPQIEAKLGEVLLNEFNNLKVDVKTPQVVVRVEIREDYAYIYCDRLKGIGGIPVGTSGRGMLLISGGIDSPVAGFTMAKRGLSLSALHFITPPYTSDRALKKVKKLLAIMARYCGPIPLYVINFTNISKNLKINCKEEYFTILMRRMMMKIAESLCDRENEKRGKPIECIVTGESLGQVASQTLKAIICTDDVAKRPHFRPLIGMDKEEIVGIAKKIGTFETSILPYEDCCTVFTPKHPKTRPKLKEVYSEEQKFDFNTLIEEALKEVELSMIQPDWHL